MVALWPARALLPSTPNKMIRRATSPRSLPKHCSTPTPILTVRLQSGRARRLRRTWASSGPSWPIQLWLSAMVKMATISTGRSGTHTAQVGASKETSASGVVTTISAVSLRSAQSLPRPTNEFMEEVWFSEWAMRSCEGQARLAKSDDMMWYDKFAVFDKFKHLARAKQNLVRAFKNCRISLKALTNIFCTSHYFKSTYLF
jgi:hypothetical protein